MDTETTGLDRRKDYVKFWSACPDEGSRYCFSREMLELWDQSLGPDPDLVWYFTNQTFDFSMIENSGARAPKGDCYDTLPMDWLYDENRQGRHGLKETAFDHLGLKMRDFKEAFPGRKRGESIPDRLDRAMRETPESAKSYSGLDAWATFRVKHALQKKLEQQHSTDGMCLWDYFVEVEMPFTRVLYNCCRRGVMVDVGYLEELSPRIEREMDILLKKLYKINGREINPKSPLQLRELFFGKLNLPVLKMTPGGDSGNRQPSTDESCLQIWAAQGVEAALLMLTYRELAKMKGTYVDGLRKWADEDFRIHPTLTQHVTVTGRLSSVDPNLQNIPRPDGDQFGIRTAFIPKDGCKLLVVDYEQLEMRLMAHFSQDDNMIDVIRRGWDIHAGTASLMYNYDYDAIIAASKHKKANAKAKEMQQPFEELTELEKAMVFGRQASKETGFGLNYGEGPEKLGKKLGLKGNRKEVIAQAEELIEKYFAPYPRVREFINGVHNYILDYAMVETILGRPRRFHELPEIGRMLDVDPDYWHLPGTARKNLAQAKRQSVNSIIQGSAADVAKMAMIKCEFDHRLRNLGVEMLLQVHDELLFEVPEENVEEAKTIVLELMEHPFSDDLLVPLSADAGTGWSWATAKA
jgi:DNA polymerase-1